MARKARTPTPELDTAVDNWDRLRFKSLVKEHKEAEEELQELLRMKATADENKAKADRYVWEAELELKILARKINKLLNEEVS